MMSSSQETEDSKYNKSIKNITKENRTPKPKTPGVLRPNVFKVKMEDRTRTKTCPSTGRINKIDNLPRSLKKPSSVNDKSKIVAKNNISRNLKNIDPITISKEDNITNLPRSLIKPSSVIEKNIPAAKNYTPRDLKKISPSTSKDNKIDITGNQKKISGDSDKNKTAAKTNTPRKKISREYRPKPAHSGVPLPEKLKKFLQQQQENPDVFYSF